MHNIVEAVVLGAIAGIAGTGAGGVLAAVYRKPDRRAFAAMVGFSGGMMFAVTVFDLMPEAFAAAPAPGIAGAAAGVALMAVLDLFYPTLASVRPRHTCDQRDRASGYTRVGAVVGLGIAAHNFAEGLAVGSGYVAMARLGFEIAAVIGVHDIPEGMAMGTMLRLGRVSRMAVIVASVAAGVPMAAGAMVGAIAGNISRAGLAFSLGAAGGAMLFVTARLYPEGASLRYEAALVTGTILGIALGAFLVLAV